MTMIPRSIGLRESYKEQSLLLASFSFVPYSSVVNTKSTSESAFRTSLIFKLEIPEPYRTEATTIFSVIVYQLPCLPL